MSSPTGFLYELPVGPGKKFLDNSSVLAKIIGGWQLSGILRYQSGQTLGVSATQTNPVYSRRSDGRRNRRQHRHSADCEYRFRGADDVGDRELQCADGSLSQPRGIRPADGSVRLIDAHDRRVARVCFAERRPGHFEDNPVSRAASSFKFGWRCSTRSIAWSLGSHRPTSATRKRSGESPVRPMRLETCRLH